MIMLPRFQYGKFTPARKTSPTDEERKQISLQKAQLRAAIATARRLGQTDKVEELSYKLSQLG